MTAVRSSPDVAHLYQWAVAPRRDAPPYDIISAIDEYLTTVNYPTEESRLRFTLVNEVDAWYISAITDSRFARLREVPGRQAARADADQAGTEAPPADVSQLDADALEPIATTTSPDVGRLLSDARFHATLEGFNDSFRAAPRLGDSEDGGSLPDSLS